MANWNKILSVPEMVGRVNRRLAAAMAYCPQFEQAGWAFRCVECHVGAGTYAAGQSYIWHLHQEYQIEIGLDGVIQFETRSKKLTLRSGGALVIPWKHPHRWTCEKPGPMLGIALALVPCAESIQSNGWLFTEARLLEPAGLPAAVDTFLDEAMRPVEPSFGGHRGAARLFLLLADILELLIPKARLPSKASVSEMRGQEMAAWAVRYIEENLGESFQAQTLVSEMKISSRQLRRIFHKYVGKSLSEFLLERRMERARALLLLPDHDMQIKEIAFLCGFHSLAHFSDTFRRVYGVSPSDLRFKPVEFKSGATSFPVPAESKKSAGPGGRISDPDTRARPGRRAR